MSKAIKQVVAGVVAATGVGTADAVKYTALACKPLAPVVEGVEAPIANKRAFTVALYLAVCELLNCKPSANSPQALRVVAHVLPHCGLGYSKHKQAALRGGEVSDAGGMRGYANFVSKPAAAKLLPGGEAHSKVETYRKAALAMLTLYGKAHLDVACKAMQASKPATK